MNERIEVFNAYYWAVFEKGCSEDTIPIALFLSESAAKDYLGDELTEYEIVKVLL